MARPGHPVHRFLADLLAPVGNAHILDLGCGTGGTLAAVAAVAPSARLHGVDLSQQALVEARELLQGRGGGLELTELDLRRPLPMGASSFDAVVCHNVLECLPDPGALIREAARVARPGSRAIWSHDDFDAIVTNGADPELDRRVIHTYADATPAWTEHADGRMGRKLTALVRAESLVLEGVRTFSTVATDLAAPEASAVIGDIVNTVTTAIARGASAVTAAELEAWRSQLGAASDRGTFFFAATTFAAVTRVP